MNQSSMNTFAILLTLVRVSTTLGKYEGLSFLEISLVEQSQKG